MNRTIQSDSYQKNLLDWTDEQIRAIEEESPVYPKVENFNPLHYESYGRKDPGIVMELIKKLKVGTDITQFASPYIFLGSKSELEMRADSTRPGRRFEGLWKEKDPLVRMEKVTLQMLETFPQNYRYSLYHSKPLNPILGEIFKCSWDLEDSKVDFIAEQISHHPPMNAMYAENRGQRWIMEGQVGPRASLLLNGFRVKLNESFATYTFFRDAGPERYDLRLPDFQGKGLIFGQPEFHPVGTMKIVCKQTGLEAKVKFSQKGLSVYGRIFKRKGNSKDVHLKFQGNPLDTMELTNLKTGQKDPEWFNLAKIVYYQKVLQPVYKMEKNESRRVWYPFKIAINKDNENDALQAKHAVEQRQREKAHLPHSPKYFKSIGKQKLPHGPAVERWRYIHYNDNPRETTVSLEEGIEMD